MTVRGRLLEPLICLFVCLAPVALPGQQGERSQVVVVEGGTLIDGTGASPMPNTRIVIDAGKIKSVAPADGTSPPAGARLIRAQGKFILPGLIDGHTHWRGWTGQLFLAHGVTTIVDLGNGSNWILAAKAAEEAGRLRGAPRIFAAGDALGREPKTDWVAPSLASPRVAPLDSPAQARNLARSLIGKGADLLKVQDDVTGENLSAITAEAHAVDLTVVGHSRDLRDAVNRGLDGVAGLRSVALSLMSPQDRQAFDEGRLDSPYARLDPARADDLVALLVQKGTYVSPLLISEFAGVLKQARRFELASYELLAHPSLRYVPVNAFLSALSAFRSLRSYSHTLGVSPYVEMVGAPVVQDFQHGYANAQGFIRRLAASGGKFVAGSDSARAPTVPGVSLHQELELLVEAGLSPMQAIQSATKHPAELFRKDYKLGTVAPGKLADLLPFSTPTRSPTSGSTPRRHQVRRVRQVRQVRQVQVRQVRSGASGAFGAIGAIGASG